jgi:hypothetical protein
MEQIESAHTGAYEAGVIAATAALKAADLPILPRDQSSLGEPERSYALGWNSVWANEENRARWSRIIPADLNRIVPTLVVGTVRLRSNQEVAQSSKEAPPE